MSVKRRVVVWDEVPPPPHTRTNIILRRMSLFTYRGTSLIRKRPPPEDHPRTLGIGLR